MLKTLNLGLIITLTFFISSVLPVHGQVNPNPFPDIPNVPQNTINLTTQLSNSGLGIQPPATGGIIGTILRNVLTIFFVVGGIGTIVYFVWGAVDWVLSGGDKEKVASARKKMTNAIIGLVLLALSFVIIQIVGEVVGFNPLLPIQIKSLGEQ